MTGTRWPERLRLATGLAIVLLFLPLVGALGLYVAFTVGSDVLAVALAGGITAVLTWVTVGRRMVWWKARALELLTASAAVAILIWGAHSYGS